MRYNQIDTSGNKPLDTHWILNTKSHCNRVVLKLLVASATSIEGVVPVVVTFENSCEWLRVVVSGCA